MSYVVLSLIGSWTGKSWFLKDGVLIRLHAQLGSHTLMLQSQEVLNQR